MEAKPLKRWQDPYAWLVCFCLLAMFWYTDLAPSIFANIKPDCNHTIFWGVLAILFSRELPVKETK